ncbi:LptF/LptG family permease [Nitratifractor sp.]
MAKTRSYLLQSFGKSFLLVFLPFLLIVSLVFLIQVSILSSRINLESSDLIQFFGYLLPEILLYTIPFSLLAALANLFSRLSEENELIALFALGHSPGRLLRYLLPTMVLFTAILLVLSIMLYPQIKQKIVSFKERKLAEATLKISPNKLSQNFGDFHVYVADKDEKGYRDIVLFDNHSPKNKRIFLAKRAVASNEKETISLTLYDGIGETSSPKKVETLSYRQLSIFKHPKISDRKILSFGDYWEKGRKDNRRRGRLLYFLFLSFSPLLSYPFIAAFTIFNPRYHSGHSAMVIFAAALLIYVPAALVQKSGNVALFLFLFSFVAFLGIFFLRRRVLRYF